MRRSQLLLALAVIYGCRTVSPTADAGPADDAGTEEDSGLTLPRDDLVLHFAFDESQETLVRDLSGHGNDGAINGQPAWVEGRVGSAALAFDGVDDYLEIADSTSLRPSGAVTMTAWIYVYSFPEPDEYWGSIVGRQYEADGDPFDESYIMLIGQDAELVCMMAVSAPGAIPFARWTHVACLEGRTSGALYIDGERQVEDTAFPLQYDDNPVVIGAAENHSSSAKSEFFHGVIDDLRIYARALSDDEIRALADHHNR